MRGLGNYSTFQYNTIKNCYAVNANHDDGFQSWSTGLDGQVGTGTVIGIILRGNTIINYEDPNQKFLGDLQGIGCFDGMFEDWIIENNVIFTNHWHGITLSGAINCRIVNNTVIDINSEAPGPAWLRISNHKNGTPSRDCLIRNNLTTYISTDTGVQIDHNIIISFEDYNNFFKNYSKMDFNLKPNCSAIDTGIGDLAPSIDRDKKDRPAKKGWDIGAYEYRPCNMSPIILLINM
ncbi:MAG: hypothetical protein HQK76_17530 [Desulfobacterales bacterium]|nr:hypothetical protein [Desulfobacterales bacterium]